MCERFVAAGLTALCAVLLAPHVGCGSKTSGAESDSGRGAGGAAGSGSPTGGSSGTAGSSGTGTGGASGAAGGSAGQTGVGGASGAGGTQGGQGGAGTAGTGGSSNNGAGRSGTVASGVVKCVPDPTLPGAVKSPLYTVTANGTALFVEQLTKYAPEMQVHYAHCSLSGLRQWRRSR